MSRFELTPPARADLLEIWIYLVENASIDRADRVIASLQKAMNKLARTPGLGHLHHDLANESLRAYVVYSYLISTARMNGRSRSSASCMVPATLRRCSARIPDGLTRYSHAKRQLAFLCPTFSRTIPHSGHRPDSFFVKSYPHR